MKCISCSNVQESGKFCGNCGQQFERVKRQMTPPNQVAEPNVHVEKIKNQAKLFGTYFVQQVKNPSLSYTRLESELTNGLIMIVLLAIIISLTLFSSMNRLFGSYGLGLISLFSSLIIFTLIAIGVVLFSLFLINNLFGPQYSFKAIISLYGAHLSPFLLIGVASLLLMVLKAFTFGNLILGFVFLLTIFILPLYLMSCLMTQKTTAIDPFYGFVLYIALFSILFLVFITILADSTIGGYFNDWRYFFY